MTEGELEMEILSLLGWGVTLGFLIFQAIYDKHIICFR